MSHHAFVWKAILSAGAVACLVTAAIADTGTGVYRSGTPAVLEPVVKKVPEPIDLPSPATREAFRRFYKQAGSPRLAVFWNRLLDDQLREMESESRVVFARTTAGRAEDGGKTSTNRSQDKLSVSVETRPKNARTSPLSEVSGLRFQSGFLRPFIEAGAKMIDRNVILRLTGASRALDDPSRPVRDRQLIETLALKDHADLLIQIVLTKSDESGSAAVFHVSVVDVESGRILASFVDDATSANETGRSRKWKAVRGGYVEVENTERPRVDLERMGRMLASQTMIALSRT